MLSPAVLSIEVPKADGIAKLLENAQKAMEPKKLLFTEFDSNLRSSSKVEKESTIEETKGVSTQDTKDAPVPEERPILLEIETGSSDLKTIRVDRILTNVGKLEENYLKNQNVELSDIIFERNDELLQIRYDANLLKELFTLKPWFVE